jgi:hypothetical protein
MSCRFTTCLDSRKTGHRVRKDVFTKDSRQYGMDLPESMRRGGEAHEWSRNSFPRRDEALGPFILDTLQEFGKELFDSFKHKYENLSGQPLLTRVMTHDRDLLEPYLQLSTKLSEIEPVQRGNVNRDSFVLAARRELDMLESHVNNMKSEWPTIFRDSAKKSRPGARDRAVGALRRKFVSGGPVMPHLSLLGDISAIRASYAYKSCRADNPTFAFSMALEELCNIKARESRGTALNREFTGFMTIPKVAVRTLSALRSQTA